MAGRSPGTPKTGGRKPGSVNKKTAEAQAIADKLGIDPFKILLLFAAGDWKKLGYKSGEVTKFSVSGDAYTEPVISPELRSTSSAKAVEFLYPKRKAIDQTITEGEVTNITRTILTKTIEHKS